MVIHAEKLTRRFDGRKVVDGVSLDVDERQIFGLLGPNAAGKTTTMRMLCGILRPDEGSVRINGVAIDEARAGFGYVAQFPGQYEELTVWENLRFYAGLYRVHDRSRLDELLERYQLAAYRDYRAGTLSGGYKRRLALACALAHDPRVLFLDEPTAGIDPVTRKQLWDDFYRLTAEGKTLFVTTHYMEEAQRCHRLAFLNAGRVVARGTPDTIGDALGDVRLYRAHCPYHPDVRTALQQQAGVVLVNQFGNELRVMAGPSLQPAELAAVVGRVSGESCGFEAGTPDLEDVFIAITQAAGQAT